MTVFDFLENWYSLRFLREKSFLKILDFLVDRSSRYGSTKIDRNATTRTGQTLVSQLLWELQHSILYQMKGILKLYVGNAITNQYYAYNKNYKPSKSSDPDPG